MKKEYKRKCPSCNKILVYFNVYNLNAANKNNSICYGCAKTGKSYCSGHKLTKEHKERISNSLKGRIIWKLLL